MGCGCGGGGARPRPVDQSKPVDPDQPVRAAPVDPPPASGSETGGSVTASAGAGATYEWVRPGQVRSFGSRLEAESARVRGGRLGVVRRR